MRTFICQVWSVALVAFASSRATIVSDAWIATTTSSKLPALSVDRYRLGGYCWSERFALR